METLEKNKTEFIKQGKKRLTIRKHCDDSLRTMNSLAAEAFTNVHEVMIYASQTNADGIDSAAVWLTPEEAREFANKLLELADKAAE